MNRKRFSVGKVGLICASLALPFAGALLPAAHAVVVNNLSEPGTAGAMRIRPVESDTAGQPTLLTGDGTKVQNPNREVGTGAPGDPLRILAYNSDTSQPGYPDYAPGVTQIFVNDRRNFFNGDTVLIGSPYCDFRSQGPKCETGEPTPDGEIVFIKSGAGLDRTGPGPLQLVRPLQLAHPAGTTLNKLPTVYGGQTLRVDIPNTHLFLGAGPITVTAEWVAPRGDLSDPDNRRRLPVKIRPGNTLLDYTAVVTSAVGSTNFFVPKDLSVRDNFGVTFLPGTTDDWYTIKVKAVDAGGAIVADGFLRYKVNPVWIAKLFVTPEQDIPTSQFIMHGEIRDASSPEAANRRVGGIIADILWLSSQNTPKRNVDTSCYDERSAAQRVAGAPDHCATPADRRVNHHGDISSTIGGSGLNNLNPLLNAPFSAFQVPARMFETFQRGRYTVTVTLRWLLPRRQATAEFFVALPVLG